MSSDLWPDSGRKRRSCRRARAAAVLAAIFVVAFGVFLPAQMAQPGCPRRDRGLLRWVPPIVVSTWIADSFAGERERHTPNATGEPPLYRAILFGKIGSAVGTLLLNRRMAGAS